MNAARSLLGSALIYAFSNGLAAGLPLLLLPILTRTLTPDEYGLVAMFGVVVTAFGALTGLSVHGAVSMRYFDRDSLDFPRYLGSCLAILAVTSCATLLLAATLSPLLTAATNLTLPVLLLAVVMSCAQFLIQTRLAVWQSAKQPWKFGGFRLSQAGLDLSLSLFLVLGLGLAWQGRIAGMVVAAIALAILSVLSLGRDSLIRWPPSRDYVRNALSFGLPLVPHVVGGMLLTISDRVMISSIIGVAETGIYMVAVQAGLAIGLLTDAMNRALAPWLIETLRRRDVDRDVLIVRLSYLYSLVLICGALLVGWGAPMLTMLIAGPQFQAAASLIGTIAIGYAFGGMYLLVVNYIFYAGKTGRLAAITLCIGLFNAGLSYLLLSSNGLVGAAQSFALSQAFLFLATWWLANQVHPMPWLKALFPGRVAT